MEGIEGRTKALKEVGVKALRFGRSANVTRAYGTIGCLTDWIPRAIERLFSTTRDILDPEVLHIDNGNIRFSSPIMKERQEKPRKHSQRYNTCGDTISFGVESFDTRVRN
jgi:radical SAM superfamily enzyme with C-terminal helix-hairpin-helix motif